MTLSEFAVLINIPEEELSVRINKLSPRCERVIRMLNGLTPDGKEYSEEEISQEFVVARARIIQLRDLALKQLSEDVPT
jgi:DNA-directed RNA polymerase sigma subunit (sigma70/sigma32)